MHTLDALSSFTRHSHSVRHLLFLRSEMVPLADPTEQSELVLRSSGSFAEGGCGNDRTNPLWPAPQHL